MYSWKHFEERFVAKAFPEITSIQEYYKKASSVDLIDKVKVPSLIIHSYDDPIVPIDCLPRDCYERNEKLIVALTKKGSHILNFQDC